MDTIYKRCEVCDTNRGRRAFAKNSNTCRTCDERLKEADWKQNGTVYYKKCIRCDEKKNHFTGFLRVRGQLVGNICKECKKAEHRKRYKCDRTIYCSWSFEFNYHMVCKKCNEIVPSKDMVKQKKQCKKCLGIVPAGIYNKHNFTYKEPTKNEVMARVRRVFTKRARQAMFVENFNKEFGVSA